MFSPWIYKARIFGIDVNIEFDFWGPIFKTWQKIYEFRLKYERYVNNNSNTFIPFALKHLPNGSFIIFSYDEGENEFVQFMKNGTCIILDIPILQTNIFYGKEKKLFKIFTGLGIKSKYIQNIPDGDGKEIRVYFGNNNVKAGKTAESISKEIFGLKFPNNFYYETARLIPKINN